MNGTGALVIRAERVGSETLLARIVAMVAEAQRSRAPIQRLADLVSAWFVPAVLVIAVLTARAETLRGPGQAAMFVAVDGRAAGLLGVADPIKESTPEAVRSLHAYGLRLVMRTGDSATTARAVAADRGIDEVIAEMLPDQRRRRSSGSRARGSPS